MILVLKSLPRALTLALTTPWALLVCPLAAQHTEHERPPADTSAVPRFRFGGYAIINYYNYRWDTDPNRRDAVDIERLVFEPEYRVSDRLEFAAEIEIEHGGTGATLEFDPIEEFGEFEQEIEKGGEIVVEKLQATFALTKALSIRVGHLYVPIGLVTSNDEPDEYFTNTRNEAEAALIPTVWHETGLGVVGQVARLRYQLLVVTGLDGTGFSSATWVRLGHQGRFELVNAEDLAVVGRLDIDLGDETTIGGAAYYGNSTGNRPKPDLTVPAHVTIFDGHAVVTRGPFVARALVLYGHLQNADIVSAANRNLSNNLGVKRTPIGTVALGWFVEAGYAVLRHPDAGARLQVFARYDWYDTMYRTRGTVFDNPRWERRVVTAGIDWRPDPHFLVKASFAQRTLGLPSANRETTGMLGVAAVF